jgi:hypothetical protein
VKLSELAATQWQGRDVKIATAVALAESRGKRDATNTNTDGSTDDGPWQVNSVHGFDRNRLRSDPAYTVDAAHKVWQQQGWRAWVTYKTGAYLAFMGKDAELTSGDNAGFLDTIKDGAIGALGPAGLPLKAVDALGNPVSAATSGIDAIGGVISALADPSTYLRLGKGALGGVLIVIGVGSVVFVVANRVSSTPVVKAATGIIP